MYNLDNAVLPVAGTVVKSKSGHDKSEYFIITHFQNGFVYIANGKSRMLQNPKKKNLKHLCYTNSVIDTVDLTDKKLRELLKSFS